MAGRSRRIHSAPAVTTDDQQPIRHFKETSVLKPVSPSTHMDDWPCFLLSDAAVYDRDGEMVNQLEVDLMGPFIIRGRLEVEKDNERYLVNRNMKKGGPLWIQIESSKAFSVGAKDDSLSVPVVWASGEAGWFEIVPAQEYQELCKEMFEGVCLHYALLDQYETALEKLQKSKKKKKATLADVNLELDELLFQYALRIGDGVTLPEAHARLNLHSVFLLSHFPKDTGVYKYLAGRFPDHAGHISGKEPNPVQRYEHMGSCPLKAYDYSDSERLSSLEIADGRRRGKGRTKNSAARTTRNSEPSDAEPSRPTRTKWRTPAEVAIEDNDVIMVGSSDGNPTHPRISSNHHAEPNESSSEQPSVTKGTNNSAQVLVDALEDARTQLLQLINEGGYKKQLHEISAKSWQNKVYLECHIKQYNAVQEVFHYYAQDLVQLLDPKWYDTQIYQWAKKNAPTPVTLSLVSEEEVRQIVRRVKKSARGNGAEKVAADRTRPEVREYAGKQTPRNRSSGKAAGLRPSTGGKKRLRYEVDFNDNTDSDEDGLPKKKSKSSQYFTGDEYEEDDNDDDNNNDNIDDDGDSDSPIQKKLHAERDGASITQLVIRAEKLPSIQPQGPNQTWICEEPDCGYIVRAAHEEEGQQLISTHFEEHEKEAQDVAQETALNRVNLAVQEAARGHMPINHLLEKIRNIGEKSSQRDEALLDGHVVPKPIKKTLLV